MSRNYVMIYRILTAFALFWMFVSSAFAADPFTVANVPVDATGSNAIEAQTKAISEGQVQAATILLNRVTLPSERVGKDFSQVPPETIARMIRALEISNEKRSTQRYYGDVTIAFAPSEVKSFLDRQGMTMISSQAAPRLLVPVLSGNNLWRSNSWQNAWAVGGYDNALTPIDVLSLSRGNDSLINADQARSLDMAALKRLSTYFGQQRILVAYAEPALGGIKVYVTDVLPGSDKADNLGSFTAGSYKEAADLVIAGLEDEWKTAFMSLEANSISMNVSVLYGSHEDWLWLQKVINDTAQIQGARLDAFAKDGAMMRITYGGDLGRLRNELNFKGVEIRNDPDLGMLIFRRGYL